MQRIKNRCQDGIGRDERRREEEQDGVIKQRALTTTAVGNEEQGSAKGRRGERIGIGTKRLERGMKWTKNTAIRKK